MLIPSPKKGFLWDTKEKVFVPDPDYNKEKARKIRFGETLMLDEEIKQLLGFGENFIPMTDLNIDYLLGEITVKTTTKQSRLLLTEALFKLKDDLQSGVLPQMSYLISLGNYGRVNELAFYLLAKAYIAGLTVSKVKYIFELDNYKTHEQLINDDIVVIITKNEPTSLQLSDLSMILQKRATEGKPTILINNKKRVSSYRILFNTTNEKRLDLVTRLDLEYNIEPTINDELNKLIIEDDKKVNTTKAKALFDQFLKINKDPAVPAEEKKEKRKVLNEEVSNDFKEIVNNISTEKSQYLIKKDK